MSYNIVLERSCKDHHPFVVLQYVYILLSSVAKQHMHVWVNYGVCVYISDFQHKEPHMKGDHARYAFF